jgi:hypothetical protein
MDIEVLLSRIAKLKIVLLSWIEKVAKCFAILDSKTFCCPG